MTFNANNQFSVCDYDTSTCAYVQFYKARMTVTARPDGGFDLNEPGFSGVANIYSYRAPNGTLTLFSTTNASRASGDVQRMHRTLVAEQARAACRSHRGQVLRCLHHPSWQQQDVMAPVADSTTAIAVDATTSAVTRKRSSDSREDFVRFNTPLDGVRTRDARTWNGSNFAAVHQIPVTALRIYHLCQLQPEQHDLPAHLQPERCWPAVSGSATDEALAPWRQRFFLHASEHSSKSHDSS